MKALNLLHLACWLPQFRRNFQTCISCDLIVLNLQIVGESDNMKHFKLKKQNQSFLGCSEKCKAICPFN